ncbi:MAG: family hydrolase, partial [Clostridia bacterium]|nr:family hydrolase [Clostridia bacterium]
NIDYLKNQLNAFKITEYFDEILGLSDLSAHSKIENAKNWIKVSNLKLSEIIMIGDTIHDYEVAQIIGVNCILVCGGHNSEARLKSTGAPVIKSVNEIFDMLSI